MVGFIILCIKNIFNIFRYMISRERVNIFLVKVNVGGFGYVWWIYSVMVSKRNDNRFIMF